MEETVDVKSALSALQGNFIGICYCKIALAASSAHCTKEQSNYFILNCYSLVNNSLHFSPH